MLYDITRNHPIATIPPDDPLFDTASPPLGYMNYKDDVIHVTRPPVRRARQGIDTRNLSFRVLGGRGCPYHTEHLLFSKNFEEMVLGKYPKLEAALKKLRESWKKDYKCGLSIAVTRDIALKIKETGIIDVWHKEANIGYILPKNPNTVIVPEREDAWIISRYLAHELSWEVD
jgi:hypothetical protein